MPSLKRILWVSAAVGAAAGLAFALLQPRPSPRLAAHEVVPGVWIAGQLAPSDLDALASRGFRSLINLRPDGEQDGQPTSADIDAAARASGLSFAHVPVAQGSIAPAQVDALAMSLGVVERPVLLYCRSGKRAARTWALSEASRPGGLGAQAIQDALRGIAQPADDLDAEIIARIAARGAMAR